MTTATETQLTTQVFHILIKATPEAIWEAITTPEFTERYFHGARITVTRSGYRSLGPDDDRVFKALADPTRRHLLDRLFVRDGRTLSELESELEMTRFGVMKHLRVLEDAGLVVTRRSGREKLHFLNPIPIRLIHDRWIDKYTERQVSALAQLKQELEETA